MEGILKKSEINQIVDSLSIAYDFDCNFLKSYYFLIKGRQKVYITNINLKEIDIDRINSTGIYFGTIHDDDRIRLSVEGTTFIKPKKNFIEINKETLKSYLAAENLFLDEVKTINNDETYPFLIVKYETENLGCVSLKENILLNYVSKSRKLDYNKVF
jgi:NOL1/NOP2/fmu family ribosome biogenesis protein